MNLNAIISITIGSVIMAVIVVSMGMWYWGECSRTMSCPSFLKCGPWGGYPQTDFLHYNGSTWAISQGSGGCDPDTINSVFRSVEKQYNVSLPSVNHIDISTCHYWMMTDCYKDMELAVGID